MVHGGMVEELMLPVVLEMAASRLLVPCPSDSILAPKDLIRHKLQYIDAPSYWRAAELR